MTFDDVAVDLWLVYQTFYKEHFQAIYVEFQNESCKIAIFAMQIGTINTIQ